MKRGVKHQMSNQDKRSVFTDALETLGNIIDETQKRDAIHIAVEPIKAKEMLLPGQHVTPDGFASRLGKNSVGIVDPFLTAPVYRGEWFWLLIYPRQIKSLRHVWTHPAFPDSQSEIEIPPSPQEQASKAWIQEFADSNYLTYDDLMQGAAIFIYEGDYLDRGSLLEGIGVPDEFWEHYEIVTGKQVPDSKKRNFFTCSC